MYNPQDEITCNGCKRPVTGTYVQALGAAWHADCWRCGHCGKVIRGSFVEEAGGVYHPPCAQERFGLRCDHCGALIRGTYVQHEGRALCEKDYRDHFAPRCFYCDGVLPSTFTVNSHGQRACRRHDHGPDCTSCGRWLDREERLLAPLDVYGTALCGQCGTRAVGDREVRAYGNGFGVDALRELGLNLGAIPPVPVRLETHARIQKLKGAHEKQVDGITQTVVETINGLESARRIEGIAIVGGLAREHFEGVLAHEFGHVWLFNARLDRHAGRLAEGFCELMKDRWLARLATPLASDLQRRLAENPDPVYGDGFRDMKKAWDRAGLRGVMGLFEG